MKRVFLSIIAVSIVLFAFQGKRSNSNEVADKIFINGTVLTVDSVNSVAQAVAVKDGKILAVGTTASIVKLKGDQTLVVDLKGKTLIPGFIDGHSHFMSLGRGKSANLAAPPVGQVKDIPGLVAELQKFKKEKNVKDGEWISGFGYDPDQLAEKRHPSKEDLDATFPNNPVTLTHVSGHLTVANSYALRISGIDSTTKDPDGGIIVRKKGSKEPTGLLQEHAAGLLKRGAGEEKKKPTLEEQLAELKEQQEFYASNGLTTAQDGYSSYESVVLLNEAAKQNKLFIDIEALPGFQIIDKVLANPELKFGELKNHLKLAGFKIVADGSPQGKTAFFTKPYLTDVPGCDHDQCTGIPTVTQKFFDEAIYKGYKNNIQTYVHCNGDATIDMYIRAIQYADSALKTTSVGRRSVVIHSQFVRPDQLDTYHNLGIVAALFSNHAFFWGDQHTLNLGVERASFLSPLKTAIRKGVVATNHTDYGVTPLNQLFLLWTSVVRETRTGKVIGPNERLTPIEGLRAITINGAYEYFEEKTKGSIEKGKLADLVILSDNPVTIAPNKIKDIEVLETIKEGKSIFVKSN
jgi:predicted amidohydrolase YtcJ